MTTHILAISYKPKEDAVRDGLCRQTIRPVSEAPHAKPRRVGDDALLHGWKGVPYRSPWSWRRRDPLQEVEDIVLDEEGVTCTSLVVSPYRRIDDEGYRVPHTHYWGSSYTDELARLDYINPPIGLELKAVLSHYHDLSRPLHAQILRW